MAISKKTKPAKKTVKTAQRKNKTAKKQEKIKGKGSIKQGSAKSKKKKEDLMCFLTTACVNFYGLADDGYELSTLRKFRDNFLASTTGGRSLIKKYYRISPALVASIEKDPHKDQSYSFIHQRVLRACREIEDSQFSAARRTYVSMVKKLSHLYSLKS